jgi:hypothetical protein
MPAALTQVRRRDSAAAAKGRGWVRRLVLPVLGVGCVALLGAAVLATSGGTPAPSESVGGGDPTVAAPALSPVLDPVSTSTAHGSHAGYDATVISTSTMDGALTRATLDVLLSTEGEPASAPSASARLASARGVIHRVRLTIVGAGHWTSNEVTIAPGHYTLTAQFNRHGAPVIISMPVVLRRAAQQPSPGGSAGS